MGSIYIILCLILVAALFFWAYKSHQRKVAEVKEKARLKAIKDEEIRKRNEALRIQRLEEQKKREEERKKKKELEAEKNKLLTGWGYGEYIPVEETPITLSTPLPKDKDILYFLGIKAGLIDSTRGLFYARFKDLGLHFMDMEMMKTLDSEVVKYWFPSNSLESGIPSEMYDSLKKEFGPNESHMYIFRYDYTKGFISYDLFNSDPLIFAKKSASYIAYVANGFENVEEGFFSGECPFKTKPEDLSIPKIRKKGEPEEYHDSGIRFSITSPSPDSDIRFRISERPSTRYNTNSDIDYLLSQVQKSAPVAKPRQKTQEEMLSDETKKVLAETLDNIQRLQLNGVSLTLLQALIGKTTRLSELRVTKSFKIFLTDFDNLEITLNPLQKTVFLLFLNHPEGIAFYDLPEHKKEIMSIYGMLTGRDDMQAIENSVNSLVDRFSDAISIQISRIRKAFITILPEDIAKNYYIDGPQGEAKRITIPRTYVRREDIGAVAVDFNTPIAKKGKEYLDLVYGSYFKSFKDLAFLLRPCSHMEFKMGYVPDAFWCGTNDDKYMRIYACKEGSQKRYPVIPEGTNPLPYDDSMFLDGTYSESQASVVPPITDYMRVNDALGVWEAYLLSVTETVIPHIKASTAERRRYVMSHRDLVEIAGSANAERLKTSKEIVPSVKMNADGTATISCCYASTKQNGLCRETIHAEVHPESVLFKSEEISLLASF